MKNLKKIVSNVLIFVLIAATALTLASCNKKDASLQTDNTSVTSEEKSFTLIVADEKGTETSFTVKTDKQTVGDALLEEGLIEGEDSQYGLFVKKVNGIVADYDTDGTYWAFYVDGQYATEGIDTTKITEGATYSLKKQK